MLLLRQLLLISASCSLFYAVSQKNSFSFAAAGDYASGDRFLLTADAVRDAGVDFLLGLGDLSYTNKEAWWCQQWIDRKVPILFISGNRESGESCCGSLAKYISSCPRPFDVSGDYGIRYYFDYPPSSSSSSEQQQPLARFVMITSGILGSLTAYDTYTRGGASLVWLECVLKDARQKRIPWLIVGMHKTFISAIEKTNEVGEDLMSLLFTYKVDIVLQAHEHGYERSKQLLCGKAGHFVAECVGDSDEAMNQNGTVIVMLGIGGMDLRSGTIDEEVDYFAARDTTTFGFGRFNVSAEWLNYTFKRSSGGNLTDSFTIAANPMGAPLPKDWHTMKTLTDTPTNMPPSLLRGASPTASPNLLVVVLVPIGSVVLATLAALLYCFYFKKPKKLDPKTTEAEPLTASGAATPELTSSSVSSTPELLAASVSSTPEMKAFTTAV